MLIKDIEPLLKDGVLLPSIDACRELNRSMATQNFWGQLIANRTSRGRNRGHGLDSQSGESTRKHERCFRTGGVTPEISSNNLGVNEVGRSGDCTGRWSMDRKMKEAQSTGIFW